MTAAGDHRGWRWVVLVGAFINLLLHASINYNAGVIGMAVGEILDTDPVNVSWLMSFYSSLFALAAPIASAIINLTDCRTCVVLSGFMGLLGFVLSSVVDSLPLLFLTLGLSGVAQALSQSGGVLVLSYYFPDALQVVHGVCLTGSGLGSFLHPFLAQTFIEWYGFKGAMLMLGSLSFQSAAFGLLFRPSRLEVKSKEGITKIQRTNFQIICSKIIPPLDIFTIPAFSVFLPAIFLYSVAFQNMVVTLPGYMKRYIGLTAREGSVAAMAFGAGSVMSRLFAGFAASDHRVGEFLLFFGMSGLLSILSFCGIYIMQLWRGAYIYSFLFGVYSGGLLSLACPMMVGIVGLNKAPHGLGCIMMIFGLGALLGPPVLGVLSLTCAALSMVTTLIDQRRETAPCGAPDDLSLSVCVCEDDDKPHQTPAMCGDIMEREPFILEVENTPTVVDNHGSGRLLSPAETRR